MQVLVVINNKMEKRYIHSNINQVKINIVGYDKKKLNDDT